MAQTREEKIINATNEAGFNREQTTKATLLGRNEPKLSVEEVIEKVKKESE